MAKEEKYNTQSSSISNYYELLGIKLFESDIRIIEAKARERIQYLKKILASTEKDKKASVQKVLSEVSRACVILKEPEEKKYYDMELSLRLGIDDDNISIDDIRVHKDISFDRKSKEKIEKNICPVCESPNEQGAKNCVKCNALLTRICPECGAEVSVYFFICPNCETNIDDFFLVETTYKFIEEYVKKRDWDNVIRLHDILHENLHLPGKKGSEYLRKVGNINADAKEKRKKMLLLQPDIEKALKAKNNVQALKLLRQYTNIAPLNDPYHATYRRFVRKMQGKYLVKKLIATLFVIVILGGIGFFFYYRNTMRKQRFEKLCREAEALKAAAKWEAALNKFNEAKKIPGYKYNSRISVAINYIRNVTEKFNDAINKGDRYFKKRKYKKAVESYKKALNIPGYKNNKSVLKKIGKAEKRLTEEKNKKEFESLMKYARQYTEKKEWDSAIKTLEAASRIPGFGSQDIVKILLIKAKKTKNQYESVRKLINQYIKEKKYDKALDAAINALSISGYEKDPGIKKKIEFIRNEQRKEKLNKTYEKQVARAEKFLKAQVWEKAVKEFRSALDIPAEKKNEKEIKKKIKYAETFINQYKINMNRVKKLMKKKLWTDAQTLLNETARIPGYKDDFYITDLLNVIKKKLGKQMLLEAKEGKTKKIVDRGTTQVYKRLKQFLRFKAEVKRLYIKGKKRKALQLCNKLINALDVYLENNRESLPIEIFKKLSEMQKKLEKFRQPFCPVKKGKTWVVPELNIKMIYLTPGTFQMGSPSSELGRYYTELKHPVSITRPFWISECEITRKQYKILLGKDPSEFKKNDPAKYPADSVSWYQATEFCKKLTRRANLQGALPYGYVYRLPTEAEWEYACRANTDTPFFSGYGLSLRRYAWYKDNSEGEVHPVKTKKSNPWGLFDMHGNLKEWCYDWFDVYRATMTVKDPTGPPLGRLKILRGGGWNSGKEKCRSAFRESAEPDLQMSDIGFRIVLGPKIKTNK